MTTRAALLLSLGWLVMLASGCAAAATGPPGSVAVDAAVVGGTVATTSGGEVSYWAQYGPTATYGSETARASQAIEKGASAQVAVTLTGLARDTSYHYRLCARDGDGGGCGKDAVVRTQDVVCGQTVTADVRLTGDLACGADPLGPVAGPGGLKVGAPGIDINLGGHEVSGPIFLGGADDTPGIDNTGGFDDVTVRNGTVDLWGPAIVLNGASRNVVRNVAAQGSPTGIEVEGGDANAIRGGSSSGRGLGLVITASPGTTVSGTSLVGTFQAGLAINGDDVSVTGVDVHVNSGASRSVEISGSRNRLAWSRVGLGDAGYTGVALLSGDGNRLIGNEVAGALGLFQGQEGDGIFVDASTTGTVLRGNSAHDNEDDGIDVRSASARLGSNHAYSNGDLGIDAVAGVADLGGNRASGNGNPLQCRNVFCAQ